MPEKRVSTKMIGKTLSLISPRAGHAIDSNDLVFQWTPYKQESPDHPVIYRLLVYRYQKGIPVSRMMEEKPVYTADMLKAPHHKFPDRPGILKKNMAYVWKVEALDTKNRVIGMSEVKGFWDIPGPSIVLDPDMKVTSPQRVAPAGGGPSKNMKPGMLALGRRFNLSSFIPVPPFVWGCPVRLRPLASLPETDPPSTPPVTPEPGDVEPMVTVWGGDDAARLYLIPSLSRHAHVSWDYRYLPDCEQVLLQIAGENGFRIPNTEDARADPGVRTWYTGPAFIDPAWCGNLEQNLRHMDGNLDSCADNLNLHATDHLALQSDIYYIRLAPLDSVGNQIGRASEHVAVVCVDYPGIELYQFVVQWFWGENPFRRVYLSFYLRGEFPSLYPICDGVDARTTLIIQTGTGRSSQLARHRRHQPSRSQRDSS